VAQRLWQKTTNPALAGTQKNTASDAKSSLHLPGFSYSCPYTDSSDWVQPKAWQHSENNLALYGHKLRNVMFILDVNTGIKATPSFHYGRDDRWLSFKDKIDDRKEQFNNLITLLMARRQHNLMDIAVKFSLTPEANPNNTFPLSKWKARLVQTALQPLDRLKGCAAEVVKVPVLVPRDVHSRQPPKASQTIELASLVDTTVRILLL
jgi:hypothetical protein